VADPRHLQVARGATPERLTPQGVDTPVVCMVQFQSFREGPASKPTKAAHRQGGRP
jgi:hypothetical protein